MSLPLRKSKRKLEEAGVVEEEAGTDVQVTIENGEVNLDGESAHPPIIKKPRKDIAEAAAKAVAEEEKDKTAETETQTPAAEDNEEAKEGETKEGEAKAEDPIKKEDGTPVTTGENAPPAETTAVKEEDTAAAAPAPAPSVHLYKEEEYEDPDDGAEIPEDPDHVWNAKLVELLLYKHQYRTLHVQATYDQPLHAWVEIQRKLYRRHRKDPKSVSALTAQRITALDAINFPFTLRGAAHWDRYHTKLQEFNKKHGHCLVPRLCEFAGLGDWVIDQRRQYKLMMQGKPSVLDPERQRKLEEMGFVWVVRNRPEWNNRYHELIQYCEKYGDTKVPQHYKEIPGLGKWVAKQREQYRLLQQGKHSFLTPDRLEKLNIAGFVWSVRKDGAEDMAAMAAKKSAMKKESTDDKAKTEEMTQEEQSKAKEGETGKEKEVKADGGEAKEADPNVVKI